MSNIEMPLNAGTFCLLDRKVLDVIISLPEKIAFFEVLDHGLALKLRM